MKRLEKGERNGVVIYSWECPLGRDYYLSNLFLAAKAFGIIALLVLALGVFLAMSFHNWVVFAALAAGVVVFLGIVALVCFLIYRLDSNPQQIYEMTEVFVKSGFGRHATHFVFDQTKELVVTREYLLLRDGITRVRVYAPEEDMPFVRNFIVNHVPGEADIRYE